MSHRSRRSDDRDERSHSSSHSSHKYDKFERHRRDDSRERDYHHSRNSSSRGDKNRSKYRSRSRSPSHSSKSHSRYHRSRSRSHGYSSRHYDDHHSRSHRSGDLKDSLAGSRSGHDSREHSQSKYTTDKHSYDKFDASNFTKLDKYKSNSSVECEEQGPTSISYDSYANSESNDYLTYEPPKTPQKDPNDPDAVLEEEKQRIQRETLERLQKHLEKEGKAYPAPRPQASHPIFANDGSFLEMFKSMQGNLQQQQQQQQQQNQQKTAVEIQPTPVVKPAAANPVTRFQPLKRRGPKILKTGMVQKQRAIEESEEAQPSDSWNAYLKEVKKYKTVTCSDENMTRSLVK